MKEKFYYSITIGIALVLALATGMVITKTSINGNVKGDNKEQGQLTLVPKAQLVTEDATIAASEL